MAPVSRRPGTRSNPSSTQEATVDEYPLLSFEDEQQEQQEPILTQMEEDHDDHQYTPQFDNPSAIMPDDDDDYALKEYMASQEQISNQFQEEVSQEFNLDCDASSADEEEQQQDNNNNHELVPTYTQNTLDAASILVGGFDDTNAVNNNTSSAPVSAATLPQPEDADFIRKYNEFNRKNGINVSFNLPTSSAVADAPLDDDTELAKMISSSLRKDGIAGLSEEERAHVENCNEGKNNKKYSQNQERLEAMFFDTVEKYGGHLSILSTDRKINPYHTVERGMMDKRFYSVVGGDKNPDKHKILNDCLVLCSQKWYCQTGKNKGNKLQPSTFDKYLEQLTIVFSEKGLKYNYANDFNKNGQFHGVVKSMWGKIREKDPSFGTGSDRARTDPQLYRKFIQAIKEKKISPYEDPEHLVICVIFIFGFYLGLRGSSEHTNLQIDQLYIGEYSMEDGPDLAGLRWGGVKVPFSKCKQLKLSNTRLERDQDVILSFVENPCRAWDPWHVLCFFIDHCHPRAKKVYARILDPKSKEAHQLKNEFGKDIWFAESGRGANWNMGPTKHRDLCKEIARLSGVDKWESCTGHALRALCITHCLSCGLSNSEVAAKVRHASINSSKTYAQETTKRKANRMAVMNPTGTLTKKRKLDVKVGVKTEKSSDPEVDVLEINHEEDEVVDLSEIQPMLPKNRRRFESISGYSSKKSPAVSVTMVDDNKENVESPNSMLRKLETENKILRLQQENQRMKEELTRSSSAPPRSRRSDSSGSNRHRRFEEPEYSDESDNGRRRSRKYRRSYPLSNRERSVSPPHRYHKRRDSRHYEDESSEGEYGRYHGRY